MLKIYDFTVSQRTQPLGLDEAQPRFCWKLESDVQNTMQTSSRLTVQGEDGLFWDSGLRAGDASQFVPYEGPALSARTAYTVLLSAADNHGSTAQAQTTWETGLLGGERFEAQWITDPRGEAAKGLPVFSRRFSVPKPVRRARLYATAHGIYEAELDGAKAGSACFAPGWTSYHKRLQYQTLALPLTPGEHTLSFTLAGGWYCGLLGFNPQPNHYGDHLSVLAQLCIDYDDGTSELLATDGTWQVTDSPVRTAEFYLGEVCDLTAAPGVGAAAQTEQLPKSVLVAQEDEAVEIVDRLAPVGRILTPRGETVLDFGQNLTGVAEVRLDLPRGSRITLRHAEALDENGNFYTGNLSFAKSQDTIVCPGGPVCWRPRFTYHGFRYLCVEGLAPEQLHPEDFRACVMTTALAQTSEFLCSNPLVNQLQNNIRWSQQDNFLEIPTDCPQRSERLGWTGDICAYARTALFNASPVLFLKKWLRDLAVDQGADGAVPGVVPDILDTEGGSVSAAAFWGDAAVVVPWQLYWQRGDADVLREQYPSMTAWVAYMRAQCGENGLWQKGFQYGDWLGLDADKSGLTDSRVGATDVYFLANCCYADSVRILAQAAALLGKVDDARQYAALHDAIVQAFRKEYVTASGRLVSETQTACVLALKCGLLPPQYRAAAAQRLAANIAAHRNHLVTGFVGTPFLCDVLSENGYHALAGTLLLQEEAPSWLYEVKMGATTVWERWDSILPDRSFNPENMNSLNHYAYGSIGSWLYRRIGGLRPAAPGYRKICIAPQFVRGITWADTRLESPYGLVRCAWRCEQGRITVDVTVPANTAAEVLLPETQETHAVGSGVYHWEYPTQTELKAARYSMETTLKTMLAHPAGRAVIEQAAPEMLTNPMMEYAVNFTANEMLAYAPEAKPLYEAILAAMNESGV